MGEFKEPFLTLFEVKYEYDMNNIETNDYDLKKMAWN